MANQQRSQVGYRPFKTDPVLQESLLSVPRNDNGDFERRVAAGFQRMGAQFGERADRAAQTLGELEGRRDAIEGAPGAENEYRPTRRDSIRGRAYDKAGTQIYLEQLDQTMLTEQKAAYEKYGESPKQLKGALDALLSNHMEKHVFEEIAPEYQLAFSKRATKLVEASQKAAAARARAAAAKAAAQRRASYLQAQEQNMIDLQRQAMNLGADPDGESAVNDQLDLLRSDLEASAVAGRITPKQAEKLSEDAALTVARGTIQAKFDAAETADEKAAFAENLVEAWKADSEELGIYRDLPFEKIEKVRNELFSDATALAKREKAEDGIAKARLQDLMDDEIASIETTGTGLSAESGLSNEAVLRHFDDVKLERFQNERDVAQRTYASTVGMEAESLEDIELRVESLEPEPGAVGFEEKQKIFEAARRKADDIRRARAADPVVAVQAGYPDIQAAAEEIDWQDAPAVQAVVKSRYTAQSAVGIPRVSQMPLTMKEAYTLVEPALRQADPAKQARALMATVEGVQNVFGPFAEDVVNQMLLLRSVDRDMAELGAGYFSKITRGQTPSTRDMGRLDTASENAAAEAAFAPRADDGAWPVPNYQQQRLLVEQPELAPQFDEKFGPGAAQRVLGSRTDNDSYAVPEGTVTIAPDGSESFEPNGLPVEWQPKPKAPEAELTPVQRRRMRREN